MTALPVPLHMIGASRHSPPTPSHLTTTAVTTTAAPSPPATPTPAATPQPATQPPVTTPAVKAPAPEPSGQPASRPLTLHRLAGGGPGWGQTARKPVRQDLVLRVGHPSARHLAHAAGDPGDTISDYQFAPATITVHVGDTITWTNNGPSSHSATASNGSFDTGILKKGQSASHTFTQAGTIAYVCSIHPFMHGTVVVLASTPTTPTTTSSAASGASGTGTNTSPTATTASGPTLPLTGLDLTATVFAGAVLIGAGIGLRRRDRRAQGGPGSR